MLYPYIYMLKPSTLDAWVTHPHDGRQGESGQCGQAVVWVRLGQVLEPQDAARLHALHREFRHSSQTHERGDKHCGLVEKRKTVTVLSKWKYTDTGLSKTYIDSGLQPIHAISTMLSCHCYVLSLYDINLSVDIVT